MLYLGQRAAGYPAPAYLPEGTLLAPSGRGPPRTAHSQRLEKRALRALLQMLSGESVTLRMQRQMANMPNPP